MYPAGFRLSASSSSDALLNSATSVTWKCSSAIARRKNATKYRAWSVSIGCIVNSKSINLSQLKCPILKIIIIRRHWPKESFTTSSKKPASTQSMHFFSFSCLDRFNSLQPYIGLLTHSPQHCLQDREIREILKIASSSCIMTDTKNPTRPHQHFLRASSTAAWVASQSLSSGSFTRSEQRAKCETWKKSFYLVQLRCKKVSSRRTKTGQGVPECHRPQTVVPTSWPEASSNIQKCTWLTWPLFCCSTSIFAKQLLPMLLPPCQARWHVEECPVPPMWQFSDSCSDQLRGSENHGRPCGMASASASSSATQNKTEGHAASPSCPRFVWATLLVHPAVWLHSAFSCIFFDSTPPHQPFWK